MAVAPSLAALGFGSRKELRRGPRHCGALIIRANSATSIITICFGWPGFTAAGWPVHPEGLIYAVAFVLASGLGSAQDHLVVPGITPFLLCVTIVGTFYYLPPRTALIVFVAAFLAFRGAFLSLDTVSETVLSSTLVNGRIACAIGFALSIVNWQHFRRSKLQEQTIAEQQNILTRMAYHDSLTDLPNRRFLDELVGEEVERVKNRQRESCLIMCDVDNFKAVNDTYGHLCGDDLLRQFSQLVRESVGSRNTLVRLGARSL